MADLIAAHRKIYRLPDLIVKIMVSSSKEWYAKGFLEA
jgi:hypothetical protein